MPSKRLVLVRHAKSSWDDPSLPDHDRPLNRRGWEAAAAVGAHLGEAGLRPDLVLCSSATRARQTWARLHITSGSIVRIEDELYAASADTLLRRLHRVPRVVGCAMLIGHNPGLEDLARLLSEDGLPTARKFPTGAVVDFDLSVPTWAELEGGSGRVREFVLPRSLPDRAFE